jgi:hypothetical protein
MVLGDETTMMKEGFGIIQDMALIRRLEGNVSKNRRIRENENEMEEEENNSPG